MGKEISKGYLHPETVQEVYALKAQREQYEKQFGENSKEVLEIDEQLGALEVEILNQINQHQN